MAIKYRKGDVVAVRMVMKYDTNTNEDDNLAVVVEGREYDTIYIKEKNLIHVEKPMILVGDKVTVADEDNLWTVVFINEDVALIKSEGGYYTPVPPSELRRPVEEDIAA
ncbi:hypothetical protein [Methylocystis sp. ATCC 49242]|uniref:hypothetical protein n=1 Tax=Methylocystis sp. ATCC 49242 TaxID=622637 RepID=UPI0001F87114|nr:hypothetical protein [Methylocystis sp. ATCC 49242]